MTKLTGNCALVSLLIVASSSAGASADNRVRESVEQYFAAVSSRDMDHALELSAGDELSVRLTRSRVRVEAAFFQLSEAWQDEKRSDQGHIVLRRSPNRVETKISESEVHREGGTAELRDKRGKIWLHLRLVDAKWLVAAVESDGRVCERNERLARNLVGVAERVEKHEITDPQELESAIGEAMRTALAPVTQPTTGETKSGVAE